MLISHEAKVDVFAVTESRLDSTILDSQICPSGYVSYRKDRNQNGGGCAVFVKNKWSSKRRIDLEVDSLEMVCVEICPDKAKNTIFTVMYKPPIMKHNKFVEGFEKNLTKLGDEMNKDIITMGDFNANVIAPKLCKYSRKLMQISSLHCLNQLIKELICVTEHTSTAIELVFVNNLIVSFHMAYKASEQVIAQLFLLLRKRELAKLEPKFEKFDLLNSTIGNIFAKILLAFPGVL